MDVTIKDIAREANVSVTTVSRVLNNKPDVSSKTKKKIKKIIQNHDYKPSSLARGLVLQKSHTIGLIIPDISNPFFPGVAKGIEDFARKLDYSVIYCNTGNDTNKEKEAIQLLKSRKVDGMIVSLSVNQENKEELNKLKKQNFPIIQIDREIPGIDYPSVVVDNKESARNVVKYFQKNGHTKIGHISGNLKIKSAKDRLSGFKEEMKKLDLFYKNEWIKEGDYSRESGYKRMKEILKTKKIPSALFIANDLMALGAYEAIFEKKLKIPEDISIIGHDDIEVASLINPKLTTVFQPKYEIGKYAGKLLISKINKPDLNFERKVLSTELITRDSVLNKGV